MQVGLFSILSVFLSVSLSAQLTLHVSSIPLETPTEDAVYVSGSFDGWTGGDPAYLLTEVSPGEWEITFDPTPGILEYKFTRGDWSTVEGNENGGFLPNRTLTYTGEAMTEDLTILSWEDLGGTNSTAASNVTVIDTEFYIPQLDRTRRIWV